MLVEVIKAIIFDIDGVLVETLKANTEMYKAILVSAGYPEPHEDNIKDLLHLPLWYGVKALIKSDDTDEITRVRDMIHAPNVSHSSLNEFPQNLEAVLEELHKQYSLAIVTSRIKVGVTEIFEKREIEHLFDVVVTYEDVVNPKPHPEPLELALKKLGIGKDDAVYVGDMDSDIDAANAAGMRSIHLSMKHHQGATIGITHFDEIVTGVSRL